MSVQTRLLEKITYKDVHTILHHGYLFFFQSYNWPFRKVGHKPQIYDTEWNDISAEAIDIFLTSIFEKVAKMFTTFVNINRLLQHDPDNKYPKYSLIIYGKKPIAKIKLLLYKKNTV
jgi:hypothetical protein